MHTPCTQNAAKNDAGKASYDPATDPHVEGDAFKTLFVARLSADTTERTLQKEFEEYGPIKRVRLVTDAEGKSRGYAFLEFEHRNDMKMAYKMADGKKIDGRRVLVDVERGRTVPDWYERCRWYTCSAGLWHRRPRRLGGGIGGEGRVTKEPKRFMDKWFYNLVQQHLQETYGSVHGHVVYAVNHACVVNVDQPTTQGCAQGGS